MIRRMQYKFIAVAMGSVLLVMFIVFGTINFVNMYTVISEVYSKLAILSENYSSREEAFSISQNHVGLKPFITDEFPYETRYFSITVTDDGDIAKVDLSHIAAVNREGAAFLAGRALSSRQSRGRLSTNSHIYAYQVRRAEDSKDRFLVTFLDCTDDIRAVTQIVRLCVTIGLISYIAVFILVTVFSKYVVQPVINNMEKQKQFITNAGHELKTPLAIISANTEVLEMTTGENEWTKSTMHQVERLSTLVNSLIRLARMEENEENLVFEIFDLSELAGELAASFVPLIENDGKKLAKNIDGNIQVTADKSLVHELISILLDNASKYCDEGGTIGISLSQSSKTVRLEISNDYAEGEKIDYKRFFERFYRADSSHNSKTGGYGIGLSMAKEIVSALKGRICAGWKKGRIIFTVTFPINR